MIKQVTLVLGGLLLATTASAYHPEVDHMARVQLIADELVEVSCALEKTVEHACDGHSRDQREALARVRELRDQARDFRDAASRYHRHPAKTEREYHRLLRAFARVERERYHFTRQRTADWQLRQADQLIERLTLYYEIHEHEGAYGRCEVHGDYGDWRRSDNRHRDDDRNWRWSDRPRCASDRHRDRWDDHARVEVRARW